MLTLHSHTYKTHTPIWFRQRFTHIIIWSDPIESLPSISQSKLYCMCVLVSPCAQICESVCARLEQWYSSLTPFTLYFLLQLFTLFLSSVKHTHTHTHSPTHKHIHTHAHPLHTHWHFPVLTAPNHLESCSRAHSLTQTMCTRGKHLTATIFPFSITSPHQHGLQYGSWTTGATYTHHKNRTFACSTSVPSALSE